MGEDTPNVTASVPSQGAFQQTDTVQKIEYPSEQIDLPSKGWFYDQSSPLASGTIDIKYMTAKEEDILTSQNLIKKGVALDRFLSSVIITPGVKLDDVFVGDKNAILVAARILAYGKDYPIKFTDPSTGDQVEDTIDLTLLEDKDFDFTNHDRGLNVFKFDLPTCKKTIQWKMLTHADERAIEQELKSMKKFAKNGVSAEMTTRLKHIIVAVDGNEDRSAVKQFVDTMLARDSLDLRKHMQKNTPDLDMTFEFVSEETGYSERMQIPLGVDFFYSNTRV